MTTRNYNCGQQELYSAALLGWESCSQHLTAFTNFSPLYDAALIATRQQEVKDASELPDEQARNAQSEIFRIELSQLAKNAMENWQKLKRYISKAWSEEFQKARLEEAGSKYYLKAGNEDWESCKGLLSSGMNFIDTYLAELTANLNMPPTFQAAFKDNKNAFFTKHQQFLDSEEAGRIATENKIVANNGVYKNLMSAFLDGQEIFKDEDAIKKQFIFDHVLNLVSGTGTAGIRGTITDAATGLTVANVTAAIETTDKTAITDEDGKYIITQVASGKYKVSFTAEGYQNKSVLQEIKVGTISTLNVQLVKN